MAADQTSIRSARGERTRARLLQAAREVFAERGYAAARVEDIVEAAGVSHGTFYTYLANKPAVLDALIDQTASELQAVGDEPWDGPDGEQTITRVIGRFVEVFSDHRDVVRVWSEAGAQEPHFRERLDQVRGAYQRRVAELLAPALASTPHDPEVAAAALVAMVEGYATATPDDLERRTVVVRTLSTLWHGGLLRMGNDSAENI